MSHVPDKLLGPIVLVGQPRSGSTLLTRVLNESDDILLVNDFYYLQKVDELNAWGTISGQDVRVLADFIFDKVEVRCFSESGVTLEQSMEIPKAELDAFRREFNSRLPDHSFTWSSILENVLSGVAQLVNAKYWGWNTPQDHLHLCAITEAFPNAHIVCLLREPSSVLSSYKNVSGPWHAADRYHPLSIGLAWRKASKNASIAFDEGKQVLFVRYEDLIEDHRQEIGRLTGFLTGAMIPPRSLGSFGTNTSFGGQKNFQVVSSLEQRLCYCVIGSELTERGYLKPCIGHHLDGLWEVLKVTNRAFWFLVTQYISNPNRRKRLMKLLAS